MRLTLVLLGRIYAANTCSTRAVIYAPDPCSTRAYICG